MITDEFIESIRTAFRVFGIDAKVVRVADYRVTAGVAEITELQSFLMTGSFAILDTNHPNLAIVLPASLPGSVITTIIEINRGPLAIAALEADKRQLVLEFGCP